MSKQRLSIYIDQLNRGGAETLMSELAPLLAKEFLNTDVYCFEGATQGDVSLGPTVKIWKRSRLGIFKQLLSDGACVCYLHLSKSCYMGLLALILRSLAGKRSNFVIHIHTTLNFYRSQEKSALNRFFDITFLALLGFALKRGILRCVVSSERSRNEIACLARGSELPEGSFHIFPNSFSRVYMEQLVSARQDRTNERFIKESQVTLFTLSRLDALKQVNWSIEAAAAAAKEFPSLQVRLAVYGRGPELEYLQKVAGEFVSVENLRVEFRGFAENFAVGLKDADMYLFSSKLEGFPLSLTEAAISGITCIANNCPNGPSELRKYFLNIELVEPPTLGNFQAVLIQTIRAKLEGKYPRKAAPGQRWRSLEELSIGLGRYLKEGASKTLIGGADEVPPFGGRD